MKNKLYERLAFIQLIFHRGQVSDIRDQSLCVSTERN